MAREYGQYDSIRAKGNIQIDENLAVTGTTVLTGATTITGALTQTGAAAMASTLSVGAITTTGKLTITNATLAATAGRAMRIASTQAAPAMADGYGVIEKDLTVTGTATGQVCHESSWINMGTSAVIPSYLHVHNDGVWDGTATLTTAYIAWAKYQCILASNPARCTLWELNFSGANSEVDALFSTNDQTLALGYQAGTPTKAAVGSIPFMIDSNGAIRYIYLYDAADSD